MKEQAYRPEIREKEFLNHLKNTTKIIEENGVEAVIVGGIAVRSILNKPVEFIRPNGTTPDIDIIALGPDEIKIAKVVEELDKYKKLNTKSPEVGIESVIFSNQKTDKHSPLEILSGLRKNDNNEWFLTYRKIEKQISEKTIEIKTRNYGGVEIKTLPKETILYRYLIRMGFYKPKDLDKLQEFRKYLMETGGDFIEPELFLPYLEFSNEINNKYKFQIWAGKTYWNIDKNLMGKISGASGLIYSMIGFFRK